MHYACSSSVDLRSACSTSDVSRKACSTSDVSRKACSTSDVSRKACSTSAVLRTACWASVVLRTACWASVVLHTACSAVLSCVTAGSAAVNDKLVAASEGGRRQKLGSTALRLFVASALHPPTSVNRWANKVIPRGTIYVLRCYVQPDCHMAGALLLRRPELFLYFHYHQSQPPFHNGLTNHVGAYKSP